LFSARRQAQDLVVLSPSLPTQQWTVWVKSEGRLDAAKVDLSGPDPNIFNRGAGNISVTGRGSCFIKQAGNAAINYAQIEKGSR
jgi:hypothetical protein